MERKWVIAAFLDINGFRSWTYRAATSPEVKIQFIEDFYGVLQHYVKERLGAWSKYEGDGIITAKEFTLTERGDSVAIVDFILGLRCVFRRVKRTILDSETPPDGARIRFMDGYVYKIMVLDPNDPERKRLIPEYLEYCTNTVRGLLEVNPEIPCLATESVVRRMGKAGSVFRMRKLERPSCYPKGVNREDVDGLRILQF